MFAHPFSVRLNRARLALALLPAVLLWIAPAARAQFGAPPTTQVHDASALKPPAGARVAIVEFEDLECPDCARANPLLKDAADKYHIPWIRHFYHGFDFQLAGRGDPDDLIAPAVIQTIKKMHPERFGVHFFC